MDSNGFKNILIHTADIRPNAEYMHERSGRMDLLGQILTTGYGVTIPVNTRTPQDLYSSNYPFSYAPRTRTHCNTILTCQLLANNKLTGKQQVAAANKLLESYKIRLITEDDLDEARRNIE